ncbi:peptidyl-prolyl cis-trans isomerase CYP57 isoform X3 [Ananas comosus]|uniref:Peptidyl-prolyl cis-trans isomerase CYP57 isoform X3 n=1 Tax=Ananas comosus TaxID=4615 RepID=A0A6P5GCY4_ANACO|nr:peptidyl-prolyl cis-trans isomerase CYP57 isoform X3 [Ananas comosus]
MTITFYGSKEELKSLEPTRVDLTRTTGYWFDHIHRTFLYSSIRVGAGARREREREREREDVDGVCAGAADAGEGGGEDDDGAAGHRAVAEGGAQGGAQLRAALPRRLLRPHHLPPRHQVLPCPGRRPHRHRHRFNHRGLVACANAGTPHSNGSQFFISLDRCDWLDRKNTIFGKVTGDSLYNLLRLGEVETDKDDRPLYPPPKILSVEVLWNPFDDIIPRQVIEKSHSSAKADAEGQKQKAKAVKQLNVLSFGEEVEEEEDEAETIKGKIKSIHDVLDDPRFLKEEAGKEPLTVEEVERKKGAILSVREALSSKKGDSKDSEFNYQETDDHSDEDADDGDEAKFDARMRSRILRKRMEMGDITTREKLTADKSIRKDSERSATSREIDGSEHQISNKGEKLSLKKKGIGSEARAERMAKADADLQLLSHAEQERHMQKQKKRRLHGREEDTLSKLEKFKAAFFKEIPAPSTSNSRGKEEEDHSGWHTNRLKFIPEPSEKNGMARKDDPNDYVVHDPLLEKGKEKFNKMQAKLKRREREWAGKSLT